MTTLAVRLLLVAGFVVYMAAVYLLIHIVFARLVRNPASPVLWFFSVVTNPLTRPVRPLLRPGASDARVRWTALAMYAIVWVIIKGLLAHIHGGASQ